jgi:hypothetical protein
LFSSLPPRHETEAAEGAGPSGLRAEINECVFRLLQWGHEQQEKKVSVNYIVKWDIELQEFCFTDGVAACCCVTGKPASPGMQLVAGSEMDENPHQNSRTMIVTKS